MPFAAALSLHEESNRAMDEVVRAALAELPRPELAVLFFSPHHLDEIPELLDGIWQTLGVQALIGSVGESIVGSGREIEGRPAVSLWLASWAGRVQIEPFHMTVAHTPDGWSLLGWPDGLLEAAPSTDVVIALGDPYSFPADQLFLPRLNEDHSGLRVVGGMASGMGSPHATRLIHQQEVVGEGAVGVLLRGPVGMRCIVSQGCRPIGKPLVVTRSEGPRIQGLGGKSPLEQLQALWPQLPPRDRELFQRGPHLGIVLNEYQDKFGRGDFLIRNITGLDKETGALSVMELVRVGQTVQFHVRDAAAADEDLTDLLRTDRAGNQTAGALLFTCNGRGARLFETPDHDAGAIQREVGAVPLAGFFAAGEMGPIGGRNCLHGFTASVALFGSD